MSSFTVAECRSVTDSVGSHSDLSVHTVQAGSSGGIMTRPHMDVVCVIDICQSGNLNHRKKALEEVRQACLQIGARLNHIQVMLVEQDGVYFKKFNSSYCLNVV